MNQGTTPTSHAHRGIRLKMALLAVAAAGVLHCPDDTVSAVTSDNLALKTNLLYDAATTPNIGVEAGIGMKNSIQLFYGLNPWEFGKGDGRRFAKHWVLMPEFRWWTCTKFNGHFFGVHLLGGQYNVSSVTLPVPGVFFGGENLRKAVRDSRCQGWMAGAGVTYGYQWLLDKHWNIEAELGVGYIYARYNKYPCYKCGAKISSGHTNYAGVSKLAVSLIYLF